MGERPWWTLVIQWGLFFVLMSLVMGWLARSRQRPRLPNEQPILEYPRSVLIVGLVCSGLFVALALCVLLFPGETGSPLIALFFLGFALLGVPLIAEYVRVRHQVEPGGLRYQTLSGKRGFLQWAYITRIRYSEGAKWFRIDGTNGEVIRISAMLTSLPEFARAALQGVARERIDAKTMHILESTAAGAPPSVWGPDPKPSSRGQPNIREESR
jgi:hypothetical protein